MALEITGPADALLDEGLDGLRLRGGGAEAEVRWRARLKDDDGVVWRSEGGTPEELVLGWRSKAGEVTALRSLRPVRIDVRAEVDGGAGASRTVVRRLVAEGVRVRRWSGAVLHRPAGEVSAVVEVAGTSDAAVLGAPLLASRGVLVVVGEVAAARELVAAVPGLEGVPVVVRDAGSLVVPAGVGVRGESPAEAAERVAAWRLDVRTMQSLPPGDDAPDQ